MTFKNLILLVISLNLFSCTTENKLNSFHADLSLVRPYTFELENEKHLPAPYVAKFSKNGKQLFFVASEHLSLIKFPNALEAPVLKTISKLFKDYHPQVVIVEGLPTGTELSPKSMLNHSDKCESSNYTIGCGESFYAINEARKYQADFITGEPTDDVILKESLNAGYSTEDVLGFYLVRQIPELKRQKQLLSNSIAKQAIQHLEYFRKDMHANVQFGFPEFQSWYSRRMPTAKNFMDVDTNDSAPDGGPNATFIQKISHNISHTRDKAIVQTIERMLNQYDRVLIVYGASHLLTEEPSLKAMMGTPEYIKIF